MLPRLSLSYFDITFHLPQCLWNGMARIMNRAGVFFEGWSSRCLYNTKLIPEASKCLDSRKHTTMSKKKYVGGKRLRMQQSKVAGIASHCLDFSADLFCPFLSESLCFCLQMWDLGQVTFLSECPCPINKDVCIWCPTLKVCYSNIQGLSYIVLYMNKIFLYS